MTGGVVVLAQASAVGYNPNMIIRLPLFHHVVTAVATGNFILAAFAGGLWAQESNGAASEAPLDPAEMAQLFTDLAAPDGEGWMIAESDILRAWSRSGSAVADLLARRGEEALDRGDYAAAIGHLTALTDHAPDFARGYQLRAAAYLLNGNDGPAAADLAMALRLEPRNFLALTQLGDMLEEIGDDPRALLAFRESLKIHPHQQEALDAVARLEKSLQGVAL